jgi:hypothetical protein
VQYVLKDLCRMATRRHEDTPELTLAIKTDDPHEGWIPNMVSKVSKMAMGLLEMAGSIEDPLDFSGAEIDIVAIHGLVVRLPDCGSTTRPMCCGCVTFYKRTFQ